MEILRLPRYGTIFAWLDGFELPRNFSAGFGSKRTNSADLTSNLALISPPHSRYSSDLALSFVNPFAHKALCHHNISFVPPAQNLLSSPA
jgi:hypothetical protein